jgi:hypothetical protein
MQTHGMTQTTNNKQQTTEKLEVFSTKNFEKFSFISGNRMVSKSHVATLKRSIEKKNMLKYVPIIVTPKFEVIEGQHRLKAAEELEVPIYYIVATDVDFSDIAVLNNTVKTWRPEDYMETFISKGIEDYQTLKDFAKEFKFSISNAIAVLSIGHDRYLQAPLTQFRSGVWQITDLQKAYEFAKYYNEIAAYTEERTAKDRDLMRAVYRMYYVFDLGILHEDFMSRLKNYPTPIYRRLGVKDYLRQLEDIYNSGVGRKAVRFI